MKKTSTLKRLINQADILMMPGIYDGLSAILAQNAGFQAICLGGYGASASLLGTPDISLLTLTEMADHINRITDAVDIPLLADGDTGYGQILNVMRTVREFERAGAAGLFIEDQVFPKRCGHMEGKQVISTQEMTAKLKAALDARKDEDFVIMARTDAYAVYGLDAAIERANLYGEAGADIVFIEAPDNVEDMKKITSLVHAPCVANMVEGGKTPLLSAAELEAIGYDAVFFPVSALYAAAKAMEKMFKTLAQTGSTQSALQDMMIFPEFNELVDLSGHRQKEARYQF